MLKRHHGIVMATDKPTTNGGISVMATKKILLVIDVQNDFITGALRNEEAIKKLPNIVKLIETEKFDKICVTMDTHDKNYLNTLEGQKLPVEHCIAGTDGWQMAKDVADAMVFQNISPTTFQKSTFGSVPMASQIYASLSNDIAHMKDYEFTIVGFCTDICVISNALLLRAYLPNNKITVLRDCTAGVTPDTHEAALKTMEMCQIEVI